MNANPGMVRRVLGGIAAAAAATALALAGWLGYRAVMEQPVKRVIFAGDLDRLDHADLDALSRAIQQAARAPSMEAVRDAARRLPWVREASVRRRFPDAVEIAFQAHEAFALWNDDAVVSTRGEVFVARGAGNLPRFRGPDGSGPAMLAQYRALVPRLAPLSDAVAELRLSARGAWQARMQSGLVLELGRGDVLPRAERFAAAWPQVEARAAQARYADLRYPNGFALAKSTR